MMSSKTIYFLFGLLPYHIFERAGNHYTDQSVFTSHLKNISIAKLRRCEPPQNAHILPCMLRFFIGSRLVLECNLHF